jgi:cellulose synthase operon protein C
MLALGQADALVKEFGGRQLDSPARSGEPAGVGRRCALRMGKIAEARVDYEAALAAQPGFAPARLGQAVLALYDGQRDQALAITDELLAVDAGTHGLTRCARICCWSRAMRLAPSRRCSARSRRGSRHDRGAPGIGVATHRGARLRRSLATGGGRHQGEPWRCRLVLLDATIALRKNDRAAARAKVQQVLKVAPEHAPSLFLAGQIELADGNLASAQQHLRSALSRAPGIKVRGAP